ncbi:hypothetical protein [Klebsiella variicola]|uniref:hypothetical protein n=1 Tax=Klebsiella variicola TaxID=244366 RepID=UPI000E2D371B|nr:hypothetical protein [Klebsiella variicola]SXE17756.1 phage EaA protein [Klebsiella variicola]HBW7352191.1 hypothetical protein [Klebsiella pneumoniae]
MTTDITELAQRMSIERIKQIALGGTPTMGERESLAITALHFAEELKIATDAFQAAGLAQLAAEEALEKAQQVDEELCKLLPLGAEYMDPPDGGDVTLLEGVRRMVADYRQRIAELESRTVTVKLPDIMPPEAAPAHYWGSGESMAYADGYNKSAADLKTSFALSCSSADVNVEFE